MNSKVLNVVCFAAGAVTGWFVACQMMRKAFNEKYEEDIAETREAYLRRLEELEAPATEEEVARVVTHHEMAPEFKEYARQRLEELREAELREAEEAKDMAIEVIPPDEFGENEEYETDTLHYYADGVVTRAYEEEDEPFTDTQIAETIGTEALQSFGEWEDDSVFVRNDDLKCYFEILAVEEKWAEANLPND